MTKTSILLVGCGRMGAAMLSAWHGNADFSIDVIDPAMPGCFRSVGELNREEFDIVVLAVKPQSMDRVCTDLQPLKARLLLSIAAGRKLDYFAGYFGDDQPVIRAMPNTPGMIGQGITAYIANAYVDQRQEKIANILLTGLGQVEKLSNENDMDVVTALSGSGPAYVFLLIEEMAKAGAALGLDPSLGTRLARQTVIGAAALADNIDDTDAATLRQNVTSPGGTTAAALDVLMAPETGFPFLLRQAIQSATERSRALS